MASPLELSDVMITRGKKNIAKAPTLLSIGKYVCMCVYLVSVEYHISCLRNFHESYRGSW